MKAEKRRTKILVTAGPACIDRHMMAAVMRAGADMIRINASHIATDQIPHYVRLIRQCARRVGKRTGILLDLQGPRLRTGRLHDAKPVFLQKGRMIDVMAGLPLGNPSLIAVPNSGFASMVKKDEPIHLDNGSMMLRVAHVRNRTLRCRVLKGGWLGENKGINIPETSVRLPILSNKDQRDLKKAMNLKVDCVAVSFVRDERDIRKVRESMLRHGATIPIMAKIERVCAVANIQSILKAADAIMVARGDLGIEAGVERVPFIQKSLIRQALQINLPVVTATQMLESMIESPRPTRAEVSDVANAVMDGTTAVMLSGESAAGKHPLAAVRMMASIVSTAEVYLDKLSQEFFESKE